MADSFIDRESIYDYSHILNYFVKNDGKQNNNGYNIVKKADRLFVKLLVCRSGLPIATRRLTIEGNHVKSEI